MNIIPILFSYSCLFCLGLLDNSRGPVHSQILNDFKMGPVLGSFLFSLSSLSSFLIALKAEKIISRFNLVGPSQFGLLCFSISALMIGLAPLNGFGVIILILSSLIFGLGVGIHSVSLNLLVIENTSFFQRRKFFSGLHSMYGIASFLAPLIIAIVVEKDIYWQHYFLFVSSFLFSIFLLSLKVKNMRFNKNESKKIILQRTKPIWPMSVLFSAYVCAEVLLSSRLAFYLTEQKSFTMAKASIQLSLFFGGLLFGRVFFTFVHVPLRSLTLLRISASLSMILCIVGLTYNSFALAPVGLSMSYFFPCAMDYLHDYFSGADIDTPLAKVMISVGGSLVGIHFIFGQLTAPLGLNYSIWLLPLLLFIVLYILHVKIPLLAKSNQIAKNIK